MRNGEDFREEELKEAEAVLGHTFRNRELLKACFTHRSYSNVFGGKDNERLEFLGDAVLELVVTEELFRSSENREGALTEMRQRYVSQSALEAACARAGLMRFLRHSGGEQNLGGKTSSNLFEAAIGGLYLEGGMEPVRAFLKKYLVLCPTENYKTLLQEYVQEREKRTPDYRTKAVGDGYECTVTALGKSAAGYGESKKSAETAAAEQLLKILNERNSIEF